LRAAAAVSETRRLNVAPDTQSASRKRRDLIDRSIINRQALPDISVGRRNSMAKTYSADALNDLASLSRLFIKFGGELSELPNSGAIWLVAKIGTCPASGTDSRVDTLEPSDSFYRDMATLAGNLERVLVKPADRHRASPGAGT
jgi:hypothetical protein